MPSKYYVLTQSDAEKFARMQKQLANQLPTPKTSKGPPPQDTFTEVYVAAVPDDGIPAREGALLGSAECDIYRVFDGVLEKLDGVSRTVYNLSTVLIQHTPTTGTGSSIFESTVFVSIKRDKFGTWLVDNTQIATEDIEVVTSVSCINGVLAQNLETIRVIQS